MAGATPNLSEKRCAERMRVGEIVQYRSKQTENYVNATMEDFSTTGMFLLMAEQHQEGSQFEVRVKSDESSDEAMCFKVNAVRVSPCPDIELYGYGCVIEDFRYE